MKKQPLLLLALFLAPFGSVSAATTLITPTTITYQGSQQALGNPTALINGSGLSDPAPTLANYTTATHGSAGDNGFNNIWVTTDPGAGGGDFFADGGLPQTFTIDLGGAYTVDGIVQWGYNFGSFNANQAQTFTLEFSNDGGATYHTTLANINVPHNGAANVADETTFAPTNGSYIRMTITDNFYDGIIPGGDRVGVAELRFTGDAIPEPSIALLGGLGLLVLLPRRRA
ncbi:discoidin domain-containing protein [Luteolibacter arcticus]|uniref:Discoidin domain-containing protein n=1 Tax=Luteolibacter arcticus TaxID=1581411 RepID=A0ABT3GND0_9BACT|nr:discoidin domain-containing protein [Luteolibacter arcticus]MCW1925020.1 discoidin domain-containing protein [Luteolibacter arcticus]